MVLCINEKICIQQIYKAKKEKRTNIMEVFEGKIPSNVELVLTPTAFIVFRAALSLVKGI